MGKYLSDLRTEAMLTIEDEENFLQLRDEILFFSAKERIHHYPKFLLDISTRQAEMVFSYILRFHPLSSQSSQVTDTIRAFVGLEHIKDHHSPASWNKPDSEALQPSEHVLHIGMTEEDHELWTHGRLPKPHPVLFWKHELYSLKLSLSQIKNVIENTKKRIITEMKAVRRILEQTKLKGTSSGGLRGEAQRKMDELQSSFDKMEVAMDTAVSTLTTELTNSTDATQLL